MITLLIGLLAAVFNLTAVGINVARESDLSRSQGKGTTAILAVLQAQERIARINLEAERLALLVARARERTTLERTKLFDTLRRDLPNALPPRR